MDEGGACAKNLFETEQNEADVAQTFDQSRINARIEVLTQHSTPTSSLILEAGVGIGSFSPQLRDKNAHFPVGINLNLLNQTELILTALVSVLVSASVALGVLKIKSLSESESNPHLCGTLGSPVKGMRSLCRLATREATPRRARAN